MDEPIRVLVLGTGHMGGGIARIVQQKQGLELVGGYARRASRAGMDLGLAIGLECELGIAVGTNLEAVIEQARPLVAIQATCSRLTDALGEITTLLRHGVHVISIAEEMAFPAGVSPAIAEQLNREAKAHGVSLLGTGINPGFVLDLLVIALTGVCSDIRSITARRVNDLSPYGASVLRSQGVGLSPAQFQQGIADGSVVGHVGFPQSLHMIAAAVGWEISRIEERREPIIAQVRHEIPLVTVEPGQVSGCLHSAVAYQGDRPIISLMHPQQIRPDLEGVETGDHIMIKGTPPINVSTTPEIAGGQGTCALVVNMIPRLLNAAPGLHSMADLPVPAAMLADARRFIHGAGQGG